VDDLQKAITAISPLSPGSMSAFLGAWEQWETSRNAFLLKENAICDNIFFIKKGIARIYYYKNGKEITEWIAMERSFFLSIISFFERTPSRLIIQTITPAEISGIHYNSLMALAAIHHDIETLFRKMLTGSLILSQFRMDSIQFETAQQRYEKLLQATPEMIQKVPLSYIASFLGITLETLSRIRAAK
jgi:CRP-like cAMP-binding protein